MLVVHWYATGRVAAVGFDWTHASDVIDKGMVLSGGGALLRNLDKLFTQVTGVACYVAENPLYCVAKGTGIALEHLPFFRRSLVQ